MSVPLAIAKAAQAATRPARAVSNEAAVTTGVEAALAADRRYWSHQLLARLGDLPVTASSTVNPSPSWPKSSPQPPTKSTTEAGQSHACLATIPAKSTPSTSPPARVEAIPGRPTTAWLTRRPA